MRDGPLRGAERAGQLLDGRRRLAEPAQDAPARRVAERLQLVRARDVQVIIHVTLRSQ